MKKILFLEDKKYYDELGILNKLDYNNYEIEFEGMKLYKMNIEKIKKYDCIISNLYTNPVCNFMIIKAKLAKVKTVLISDGIIEWSNLFNNPMQRKYNLKLYHPILHDIFLCVGEEECEYFSKYNKKVIGFMPDRIIQEKVKIKKSKFNKVLITTSNTAYFNNFERESLVRIIKKVLITLEEMKVDYIFRVFDEYLVKNIGIDGKVNFIEGSFEDVLRNVDIVITTPSSISINAMYHNRAVAHIMYRDTPMFLQSGWMISESYPIEQTIKSLLMKDEYRMNYQVHQLEKYIKDSHDSSIIDKIMESEIYFENNIVDFIDTNLYNLINSNFNFNIEFILRKIYLNIKKNKYIKKILSRLKYVVK